MTPKFRSLALAAMSLAAAVSAQAAPTVINIDFNALADAALAAGAPASLTSPVQGFSFAGATVYHQTQVADAAYCCSFPNNTSVSGSGFIQNRFGNNNSDVNTRVEVAFDSGGVLKGRDIQSMTFSFANGSTAMEFLAYDETGAHSFTYNPGQSWTWTSQVADFSALGVVNRIAFVSRATDATFAIDNFSFTLADTGGGGGGTVPEPAGLGLVALALAAAGLTTRKRRA
jgi:hypothetical protein